MSVIIKKRADNKPGKISLFTAIFSSLVYGFFAVLIELELIINDSADLVSFLINFFAPLAALIPLTIGLKALYSDKTKTFAIAGIVISGSIILFTMIGWIRLFLFFNSFSGFGSN